MLGLIEQFLTARLQADPALQAVPRPVLLAGAAAAPKAGSAPCLVVWARTLRTPNPDPGADDIPRRDTARLVRRLTLAADSSGRGFVLPDDGFDERADQIAEVSVDGRQLLAGGDYMLDGRTIRCLRDPGGALVVRILGEPAAGYVERGAAEIDLVLRAWGAADAAWDQQVAGADALLARGVAVVLTALGDRDVLDLAVDEAAGFELRLLQPRARVGSVSRMSAADGMPNAETVVSLRGDMELTLARGAPEATGGTITQVTLDAPAGVVVR